MQDFLNAHKTKIKGVLSCFDRVIFRGYLPIQDGRMMAQFLNQKDIRFRNLKTFLLEQADVIKAHAKAWAEREGRPFEYLPGKCRMHDRAKELMERDGIEQGLVCIFRAVQPCRTFSFRFKKGRPYVQPTSRKCLYLYYYFVDPRLGLIHVKIQTWFPLVIQVYLNGHEWLANKFEENNVGYTKIDNTFIYIEDYARAQSFSDRFTSLDWPKLLGDLARKVNPLMETLLKGQTYYWVTTQSEYATDVVFKNRAALGELYPRLLSHSTLCFGAKEVMRFLGRKLVGQFQGELVTDLLDLAHKRIPGARVKHRVKSNWIKMYDKRGLVLRIETVINNPEDFRVRKSFHRKGELITEWVPMRKGVAYLFRYRDVSCSSNSRYLDALAVISDPTTKVRELDSLTKRKRSRTGRTAKAFNPLARDDLALFQAIMDGAHSIRGFTNRDIRARLASTSHFTGMRNDRKRQSSKVSRILHRFHAHHLIAKIPRSRRWRTTRLGRRLMATAIQLREINFPQLLALAA